MAEQQCAKCVFRRLIQPQVNGAHRLTCHTGCILYGQWRSVPKDKSGGRIECEMFQKRACRDPASTSPIDDIPWWRQPTTTCEFLQDIVPLRSEEHTSELQSPMYLVCRLL